MDVDTVLNSMLLNQNFKALIFLLMYVLGMLLARWLWIVRPANDHLRAQVEMIRAELMVSAGHVDSKEINEKIKAVEGLLETVRSQCKINSFLSFLVGNSGTQLLGWRLAHKAERLLCYFGSPETVNARLLIAKAKLSRLDSGEAINLIQEIDGKIGQADNFESPTPVDNPNKSIGMTNSVTTIANDKSYVRKVLLVEAMEVIHEDRDTFFQGLADFQNKTMWFTFTALFIILVIVFKRTHNEILLVFGAIGGLLSKLRGVVRRKKVPTDFGASWSPLFLSPLVGALTGWSGVLLVVFFKQQGLLGNNLFDDLAIWWSAHEQAAALALAIAFGFSATFFERVMEGIQGEMEGKIGGSTKVDTGGN